MILRVGPEDARIRGLQNLGLKCKLRLMTLSATHQEWLVWGFKIYTMIGMKKAEHNE